MAVTLPSPETHDAHPLEVVVAEGHGLVRAGVRALLERQPGIVVAAEAASAAEAVEAARASGADVVLIAHDIPGGGIEAARRIVDAGPDGAPRVVMLMGSASDEAVFGALRAGTTGLLGKDPDPDDLVTAVRAAARGEAMLAPRFASRLVADFMSRPDRLPSIPEELEELTAREREVLELVACGLSNEEIAERLVVTRATAKTHVSRALYKLHARDRAQLVVLAYEAGLVRPRRDVPDAPGAHAAPSPVARFGHYASSRRRGAAVHRLAA